MIQDCQLSQAHIFKQKNGLLSGPKTIDLHRWPCHTVNLRQWAASVDRCDKLSLSKFSTRRRTVRHRIYLHCWKWKAKEDRHTRPAFLIFTESAGSSRLKTKRSVNSKSERWSFLLKMYFQPRLLTENGVTLLIKEVWVWATDIEQVPDENRQPVVPTPNCLCGLQRITPSKKSRQACGKCR